jgi:hypothetical protein
VYFVKNYTGRERMTKPKVGRPPQTDADGNRIDKTLINLTIPVTLKNFLDKYVKNRSEFFTEMVTKMYIGLICPKCYSDEYIREVPVGTECDNCNIWLRLNDCPNCGTSFDPREFIGVDRNPHFNPPHGSKQCSKCMKV